MEEIKNAQSSVDWISANDKIAMAKKAEEIIKAFNEGKEIWRDCMHSQAIFKPYRVEYIKDLLSLLSTEPDGLYVKRDPKSRPYKDATEFRSDMKVHGLFLECQGDLIFPCEIRYNGIYFDGILTNWKDLFENYKWEDGSECGVLDEN